MKKILMVISIALAPHLLYSGSRPPRRAAAKEAQAKNTKILAPKPVSGKGNKKGKRPAFLPQAKEPQNLGAYRSPMGLSPFRVDSLYWVAMKYYREQ